MPNYCQIQTQSHGEFFSKCGTAVVAGRSSNTSNSAGDDFILVSSYSLDGFSTLHSGSLQTAGFTVNLTVPLMPPAVASALNILNSKDKLTKMILKIIDGTGMDRNIPIGEYTAEDGILLSANIVDSGPKDSMPTLSLVMDFEKVTFDNLLTNTTGTIKTSGSGV